MSNYQIKKSKNFEGSIRNLEESLPNDKYKILRTKIDNVIENLKEKGPIVSNKKIENNNGFYLYNEVLLSEYNITLLYVKHPHSNKIGLDKVIRKEYSINSIKLQKKI